MSEPPMTPLERIQTLAAAGNPPPTPPGCAELANMLGELGRVAMSDSQTSIGNNNNNRSLRRNRFSFNGRKPSFSWLSSTSSINSTAPVKGDSLNVFHMTKLSPLSLYLSPYCTSESLSTSLPPSTDQTNNKNNRSKIFITSNRLDVRIKDGRLRNRLIHRQRIDILLLFFVCLPSKRSEGNEYKDITWLKVQQKRLFLFECLSTDLFLVFLSV